MSDDRDDEEDDPLEARDDLPFAPGLMLEPLYDSKSKVLALRIWLVEVDDGDAVELAFIAKNAKGEETTLGTAKGKALMHSTWRASFVPDQAPPPASSSLSAASSSSGGLPQVCFRYGSSEDCAYVFALGADTHDVDEGDTWTVVARATSHELESQSIPVGRVRRRVEEKRTTYNWYSGHEIKLYNDGSEDDRGTSGAFADMVSAIKRAEHFVFIVDWSFQPLFRPTRVNTASPEDSIGALLIKKTASDPSFVAAILAWKHPFVVPDDANNKADDDFARIAAGLGLACPANLLWRLVGNEGVGWSHHQKFMVLDAPGKGGRRELRAFWGGLDLTKGRFDWPEHVVSAHSARAWPLRQRWQTRDNETHVEDWYNCEADEMLVEAQVLRRTSPHDVQESKHWQTRPLSEKEKRELPRQPWHDVQGSMQGPAAWDFAREFVGRHNLAYGPTGEGIPLVGPGIGALADAVHSQEDHPAQRVWKVFEKLHTDRDTFVQQFEPHQGKWTAQVYRSMQQAQWGPPAWDADKRLAAMFRWLPGEPFEPSIQHAYMHAIKQAERFIYIENQYFMGSGELENDVPDALVDRILHHKRAGRSFHVYIVIPMFPEGNPVSGALQQVRRNEWVTIEAMIKKLGGGNTWRKYLSFYFLANWEPKRVVLPTEIPLAVHTTADEQPARIRFELLRQNQRYMVYPHTKTMIVDDRYFLAGSCNLNDRGLAGDRDSEIAAAVWPSHGHAEVASYIRDFRKRLWKEHMGSAPCASSDRPEAVFEQVRSLGDLNFKDLYSMAAAPVGHLCRWPFVIDEAGKLAIDDKNYTYLPDAPIREPEWSWDCPGKKWVEWSNLAD